MSDTNILHTKRRWYLWATVLLFSPVLLSRGIGIANSFVATDVRYMETVWPTVLYELRQLFSVMALSVAIAAITAGIFRFHRKCGAVVLALYSGILFADALAAFLIDVISGAVGGAMVPLALLTGLGNWLVGAMPALLSWLLANRCAKNGRGSERAVLLSALFSMALRLLLETVYLLQFLIQVEFLPYTTEIIVIVGEYLRIVFLHGGLLWLMARGFGVLFARFGTKVEKS